MHYDNNNERIQTNDSVPLDLLIEIYPNYILIKVQYCDYLLNLLVVL